MSNRLLGLLIILGFILLGILFFIYYFVYYNGNIQINSNIEDYKVELYNKKLLKTSSFECPLKECKLKDISPFEYSLSVRKSGYKDYTKVIKIGRNEGIEIDVSLEKDVSLERVELKDKIIDKNEKLNFLKEKKNIYTYFDLGERGIFYFKENQNNLDLFKNTKKLLELPNIAKEDIDLQGIVGIEDYIFIKHSDKKYIYSIALDKKTLVDLGVDVNYVKSGLKRHLFHFVTDKGTYIFDKYSQKIDYFSYFTDFVYFEDSYIGVITKDDKRRLTNLGIDIKGKNIIVNYNPNTKEKKVLYDTDLDIIKIYKSGENYMFVASDQKEYKLDNF